MDTQNIKNLRLNSTSKGTRIPDTLTQHQDLRYVLIKKGGKKPSERKWQSEKNYPVDHPKLLGHLAGGGNYGIACGFGDLVVFDSDEEERLSELGVLNKLPRTFIVHTGGGGSHRYYLCSELKQKIILFDPELKDLEHPENPLHLGEIQSNGQQVVGPGSIHPNGNQYEIIDDSPITEISLADLMDAIRELKTSRKKNTAKQNKKKNIRNKAKRISKISGSLNNIIKIEDVAKPNNVVSDDGTEIQGSHPIHGSASGKNFSINSIKNTWHCFRCDSGGGPFEWLAVKSGLIICEDAGPGCLRGKLFRQVLEIARGLGYEIPDQKQSRGQVNLIENRIVVDKLPEDLPTESQVIVVKGSPRIGKTYWATKQLIKAGSGNYIAHNHATVSHALHNFEKQGGRSAVHLEGKSRPGMCRYRERNCKECELYPNEHDDSNIDFTELERRARDLLRNHGILTKEKIPYDLCPYYTLKTAEKFANYCFTVPHFIEEIEPRQLIVLDEDPTLSHFVPPSPVLFRYKKEKNENKFENALGKALEQVTEIRERIEKKDRIHEEDKLLLWSIDSFGGINDVIKTTMSGEITPEDCCHKIEEQIKQKSEVTYDNVTVEKAFKKLDNYHTSNSSEIDIKDYILCWFHLYGKKPLFTLSSGRSGYKSVYLIGDATRPTVNMNWSTQALKSGQKILIIGNTQAELFGKALGNAVVIEISDFKYAKNYVVIPVDSSGEDMQDGQVKNQRLKITKFIKALAGNPDSKERHPVMALTGSKKKQEALIRSIGGISHASQEEGEIGQQWNYQSGMVNVFTQNSTVSRGLDVDKNSVLFVYDADFALPFWSAAIEAEEDGSRDILDSIIMDETTNSVLRISPIVGGDELRPKIVIVPRNDFWKIRYIDDRVLDGKRGGRTPDIEDITTLLKESNIVGTIYLNETDTLIDNNLNGPDWKKAVQENKLLDIFRIELDRISRRGKYTEEELLDAENRIFDVLKRAGRGKWISIQDMRARGLRCKDALIRPALERLHYECKVDWKMSGKRTLWSLTENNN